MNSSYKNPLEAEVVVEVIRWLRVVLDNEFGFNDIGVIAPYKAQKFEILRKIREVFNTNGVEVNTIDAFQGGEKEFIILSTTRAMKAVRFRKTFEVDKACSSWDTTDEQGVFGGIGFLSNPKRTNIALTRAKRAFFLVGNRYTLEEDELWNSFLKTCEEVDYECLIDYDHDSSERIARLHRLKNYTRFSKADWEKECAARYRELGQRRQQRLTQLTKGELKRKHPLINSEMIHSNVASEKAERRFQDKQRREAAKKHVKAKLAQIADEAKDAVVPGETFAKAQEGRRIHEAAMKSTMDSTRKRAMDEGR